MNQRTLQSSMKIRTEYFQLIYLVYEFEFNLFNYLIFHNEENTSFGIHIKNV